MKTYIFNTFAKDKSTGKIAYGLYQYLRKQGHNVTLVYGQGNKYSETGFYHIGNRLEKLCHIGFSRIFGLPGCLSTFSTNKLLRKIKQEQPDVVYLFNIHGYYLNEYKLLNYLKKNHIRTIYTMLDEYPFMGKCGFAMGCEKYKMGCIQCEHIDRYPASLFFRTSSYLANKKKEMYTGFKELIFVAIEYTLNQAKDSYILKGMNTSVADEAIDVRKYTPRNCASLRKKLGIPKGNKIIVCIAVYPSDRKGGQFFLEAAKRLENRKDITFVHVGFGGDMSECPSNYIPISYVTNQEELCEYYSLGDLFCFPSLSETIPSTCLEALSCGSPLLVFNISGMPYIADNSCSYIVPPRDVDKMIEVIIACPFKNETIIETARSYAVKRYDNQLYFEKLEKLAHNTFAQ